MIVALANETQEYPIESNHFYLVTAIIANEKGGEVLAVMRGPDDTYPYPINASDLQVIDDWVPEDWVTSHHEAAGDITSFPEWANNPMFYETLDDPQNNNYAQAQANLSREYQRQISHYVSEIFGNYEKACDILRADIANTYKNKGWEISQVEDRANDAIKDINSIFAYKIR